MYPTIVIVLVETQLSMKDICEISLPNASRLADPATSEARAATLGHPPFAVELINSTMDNEAKSPPSRAWQSQGVQGRSLEKVILQVRVKESRVSASV